MYIAQGGSPPGGDYKAIYVAILRSSTLKLYNLLTVQYRGKLSARQTLPVKKLSKMYTPSGSPPKKTYILIFWIFFEYCQLSSTQIY